MATNNHNSQRLEERRLFRAKELASIDTLDEHVVPPTDAVLADPLQLSHNNTYGRLPRFYVDRVVACRQCGKEEVWPATRQKWWYELAKASIHSQAVLCRSCRQAEKESGGT